MRYLEYAPLLPVQWRSQDAEEVENLEKAIAIVEKRFDTARYYAKTRGLIRHKLSNREQIFEKLDAIKTEFVQALKDPNWQTNALPTMTRAQS